MLPFYALMIALIVSSVGAKYGGVPRVCVREKEGVRCCWAVNQTTSDDGDSYASLKVCDGVLHPSPGSSSASSSQSQPNNGGNSQYQANGGQEIPETGPMTAERIFWFNNNLNINNNNQVTLDLKVRNIGRRKWKNL